MLSTAVTTLASASPSALSSVVVSAVGPVLDGFVAVDEVTVSKGIGPASGVLDRVGEALMILGACFALLAGIGIHRFGDAYSRMHAAAKSPTLGLILVAVGAALRIRTAVAVPTLVLVVILQLLTSPVATHVAARSVHLRMRVPQDGPDELARDESDGEEPAPGGPVFDD